MVAVVDSGSDSRMYDASGRVLLTIPSVPVCRTLIPAEQSAQLFQWAKMAASAWAWQSDSVSACVVMRWQTMAHNVRSTATCDLSMSSSCVSHEPSHRFTDRLNSPVTVSPILFSSIWATCKNVNTRAYVNFHSNCEAQTLGSSLNVGLKAGYLSVRTAGGTSDRRWLKAHHINGLTYLPT